MSSTDTGSGTASTGTAAWIRSLAAGNPLVSVVIPIRQEARQIQGCVEAVLSQIFGGTCEVLVVDGISTDGTQDIVREIAERDPRVTLLENPSRIVPTAMNIGIRAAAGAIVVRVDGHCRIPEGYIAAVLQAFVESGAECVGGAMVAEGEGFWGRVIARATSSAFGMGGQRFHGHGPPRYMDTVYLGAYPKQVLLDAGLYDERFVRNQDDELNYRIRARGGKVYFSSRIWAKYTCRSTLGQLASQYAQYGWWKVRLYAKHLKMLRLRHLLPAVFLLSLILPIPAAIWLGWGALLFPVGLVALHAAIGAMFCVWERVPLGLIPGAIVAFLVLHLSYGAGFLAALVTPHARRSAA